MADKRRSASGKGHAASGGADVSSVQSRGYARRPGRFAADPGGLPDDTAVQARALALRPAGQPSLVAGGKHLPVTHCCRATRRLVGELFDLACMGHVLDLGPGRRPQCHVRQISMYLCRVVLSLSYGSIGRALGRDRSTVMHACAAVEDRRDDRAYDAFVERCERCVLAVFATREAGHGEV